MDTTKLCTVVHTKPYKSAHRSSVTIPPTAISAGMLKPLEVELQKRGLLRLPKSGPIAPLWFLAETEKNIYLWRNGLSILDAGDFDFLIDLKAIMEKRMAQLEAGDESNPLVNKNWALDDSAGLDVEEEIAYIESFIDATIDMVPHLSALSQVARIMEEEPKEIVVLPVSKAVAKTPPYNTHKKPSLT